MKKQKKQPSWCDDKPGEMDLSKFESKEEVWDFLAMEAAEGRLLDGKPDPDCPHECCKRDKICCQCCGRGMTTQ